MGNNGSNHAVYKLFLFDWDGTLAGPENSPTFRAAGEAYIWLPGRTMMLQDIYSKGVSIGIATNQGGIAAGHLQYSETREAIYTRLATLTFPVPFLMCPYVAGYPASERWRAYAHWRKPSPTMWLMLAAMFPEYRPQDVLVVGDRHDDKMSADLAGFDFAWVSDFMLPWIGRPEAEEIPF